MEERFDQKHPRLFGVLVSSLVVLATAAITLLLVMLDSTPPEFSATVSGYEGLVRSAGAGAVPPSFRVALRVKNDNVWRHCFEGRATVEYDGVPLAFADLDGFCVPAKSVVEVPVLAAGEGLGVPDQLYESLKSRRERQERVPLEVRLMLERKNTVNKDIPSMVLRCTAMLDGMPDLPFRCLLFFVMEPGRIDGA